ncbi:MAG: DUF4377 domain-containing protein [Paraprevotella sp.]|nr:DUF4377 domain-containing protein [Paraprevotella sp.]
MNKCIMITKGLGGILFLFFCICCGVSCHNDDEEGRKITDHQEYVLTVASKKVPGLLTSNGSNYLKDIYAVKKDGSNDWSALGSIRGFDFKDGYECQIEVSETSYLDYSMGEPAWTEYKQLGVRSEEKKNSEGLPSHFIPEWYYKDRSIPEYRYAVEADKKEEIETDLKAHSIFPLRSHCLIYASDSLNRKWIIVDDRGKMLGTGTLKTTHKDYEEFSSSYQILVPSGQVYGYMEWIFLDEAGNKAYPPFDVFLTEKSTSTRSDYRVAPIPNLYYDLTEYYKSKYPEAGVKAVVVSYTIDM